MPKSDKQTSLTKQEKKPQSVPTHDREGKGTKPIISPLLRIKQNISVQVNLDFYNKFVTIRTEAGFESDSEALREAMRRFMRKEAWSNQFLNKYMDRNDGGSQ